MSRTCRVLTLRALVVGCAAVTVLSGCSHSSSAPEASPTTAPDSSSTAAPNGTSTSLSQTGADLATLLVSTVPSGFARRPDSEADTGPTDIVKASHDDISAGGHDVLVQAGFVGGYQRLWADRTGVNQNILFLYEFKTPGGAQGYLERWRTTLEAPTSGLPVLPFTPPFLPPGAQGLRGQDQQSSIGIVLFAKGPYAVQAVVNGKPNVDQSGAVSAFAVAQYTRLP